MKKYFQILFLIISFLAYSQEDGLDLSLAPEPVEMDLPTPDQSERIVSFKSDITIAENAEVTVIETIHVYANGSKIRRGIFRALPTVRNINGKKEKSLLQNSFCNPRWKS